MDDVDAELAETFTLELTSVRLTPARMLNTSVVGGLQVDIPPLIDGTGSRLAVTIEASDDPYGTIEFQAATLTAHEWQGVLRIPLVRKGKFESH